MSTITVPPPSEILERLRACREEMQALKRLLRLSQTAQDAEQARQRRSTTRPKAKEGRHAG
jgi:hypothetical protein